MGACPAPSGGCPPSLIEAGSETESSVASTPPPTPPPPPTGLAHAAAAGLALLVRAACPGGDGQGSLGRMVGSARRRAGRAFHFEDWEELVEEEGGEKEEKRKEEEEEEEEGRREEGPGRPDHPPAEQERSPRSQLVTMLDRISTARGDRHRLAFLLHASTSIEARISREGRHLARAVHMCLAAQGLLLAAYGGAGMSHVAPPRGGPAEAAAALLVRLAVPALALLHAAVTLRCTVGPSRSTLRCLAVMKRSVDEEIEASHLEGGGRSGSGSDPSSPPAPSDGWGSYEALVMVALGAWILIGAEAVLACVGAAGELFLGTGGDGGGAGGPPPGGGILLGGAPPGGAPPGTKVEA